ncbi:MAG: YihY/virulence factor BrkB family protein [Ruminococcaceae bacterium]|nr:YihY/virulence factor BrkB family protein [Oscillospiraceae bacterium]
MNLKTLRENKFIDIIFRAVDGFFKYRIDALAAEVTFYLISLFFPLIMLIFAIISRAPIIKEEMLWNFLGVLPTETLDALYTMLQSVTHTPLMVIVILVITMWSMSCAVEAISRALNKFYHTKETRNFVVIRVTGLLFAGFIVVAILVSFVLLVYGEILRDAIGRVIRFIPIHMLLWDILRWVIPFVVLTISLAIIYKVMPNRKVSLRSVLPGAVLASIAWAAISIIFSYFANNFAGYHLLYGSVAGVVMLFMWLFMSSYVIILGGYFNAGLYRLVKKELRERIESETDIS